MIKEVRDFDLLLKATEPVREIAPIEDLVTWFENPKHVMMVVGDNVGLCTYEYPGLYNAHWFYTARGKEAIDLGKAMIRYMFENKDAQVIRGMIRLDFKASRWATRKVGLRSLGIIPAPHQKFDYELFYTNKEEFLNEGNKVNG